MMSTKLNELRFMRPGHDIIIILTNGTICSFYLEKGYADKFSIYRKFYENYEDYTKRERYKTIVCGKENWKYNVRLELCKKFVRDYCKNNIDLIDSIIVN